MKKLFGLLAVAAAFSAPVHADESTDNWFNDGVAWYEHPCGMQAFAKYGRDDSAEVRRAYQITLRDPAQCERLFP